MHTGAGGVPWLFLKGQVCEMFGWTFQEFDEQPADQVLQFLHLKGLYDAGMKARQGSTR